MAHFVFMPFPPPMTGLNTNNPYRRNSTPLPQPPQSQAEMTASEFILHEGKRSDSVSSSSDESTPRSSSTCPAYVPAIPASAVRRNSAMAAHRNPRVYNAQNVRTRSLGFGAGVVFEREFTAPPTDEDVIIVTVKLSNKFRRGSVEGCEDLPSRPQPRSFLRRLSTRMAPGLDHSAEKEEKYKAVKMPRGEYKRYFARDKDGNYAETEPEREWDEQDLMKEYAEYQDIPLHTILC